ncbi:MAG: succinylglutamate desuccinylase/aspartoacylase family protein [Mesorhizobium sp.]|nr:succinylglutamate desuccinylase/aspartoacylase family protein [Mesorhizobium sp.]MCO5164179.1 succinylglutamate desuccinylase/aspartoacylase family protein [Mesorhizobium sp.]
MTGYTQVWAPLDFEADGKQCDWLRVPHSTDLSGYGVVPIPIVCIRNGKGPTALLLAGSHGDEYEGQVALAALARDIEPADVRGRIIILPALNAPAVGAGRRVSPLDEGNLNRSFPGDPVGGPTEMIAHYVTTVLLAMADLAIDLHAGGRSCDYLPCALIRSGGTENGQRELTDLAIAFGAPVTSISDGSGGGGRTTFSAVGQSLGVPVLTAELGGRATLSREGLAIAEQGLRRVLKRAGILPGIETDTAPPTRFMRVRSRGAFVYAMGRGLFEPAAELGAMVEAGQLAGVIHAIDRPWQAPEPIAFTEDGMVACRRAPMLTVAGDCLYKLLVEAEPG